MAVFKMQFNTDNAAFEDKFHPINEFKHIFTKVLDEMENWNGPGGKNQSPQTIRDSNGNTIGYFNWTTEDE